MGLQIRRESAHWFHLTLGAFSFKHRTERLRGMRNISWPPWKLRLLSRLFNDVSKRGLLMNMEQLLER
jgi:hypothetical protein